MPTADFFERLGLFVRRGFLPPDMCRRLRSEMKAAVQKAAGVAGEETQGKVKLYVRKTDVASVTKATRELTTERLLALKTDLAAHFSEALTALQPVQFLNYAKDSFFAESLS